MRRWLISDTHFGHTAIQKHCRRPPNVDEIIARNWKRLVAPEDMVIHLGDVAFTFVNLRELLGSLPGRKILVRGNHDAHTVSWYMENGFDFACDSLTLGGVLYTHIPIRRLPWRATLNIHGHLHNNVPEGARVWPRCRLFSLEYLNYEPRQIDSFLKYAERRRVNVTLKPEQIEEPALIDDSVHS